MYGLIFWIYIYAKVSFVAVCMHVIEVFIILMLHKKGKYFSGDTYVLVATTLLWRYIVLAVILH